LLADQLRLPGAADHTKQVRSQRLQRLFEELRWIAHGWNGFAMTGSHGLCIR
jgi:hypothetical protein